MVISIMPERNIDIYWVVGYGTNIGKTTYASALIRYLNRIGKKSIGFKPFGGVKFGDHIDALVAGYKNIPTRLFGADATLLAQSSPLTSSQLVEVIAPSYRLSYIKKEDTIVTRAGALLLGNREYFRLEVSSNFLERPDVKRIMTNSGIPLEDITILDKNTTAAQIDLMFPDKKTLSYNYLCDLGPEAMVIEGAAHHLPLWQGGPMPNHIFLIDTETIYLFSDVNVHFDINQGDARVPQIGDLAEQLLDLKRTPVMARKYLVESKYRGALAEKAIKSLLTRAHM